METKKRKRPPRKEVPLRVWDELNEEMMLHKQIAYNLCLSKNSIEGRYYEYKKKSVTERSKLCSNLRIAIAECNIAKIKLASVEESKKSLEIEVEELKRQTSFLIFLNTILLMSTCAGILFVICYMLEIHF